MLLEVKKFCVIEVVVVVTDLRDKGVPEDSSVDVILKRFRQ